MSYPTSPPDFQSRKPINVALEGLHVNGFITWKFKVCPSAIKTCPTSSILTSLTIYGSTLSFKAFIPSRARVHLSKLFALYHLAYLLNVTSVGIFSAFFSFRIYCVNDIALPIENLFGDKSMFKNILISFSLRLVL